MWHTAYSLLERSWQTTQQLTPQIQCKLYILPGEGSKRHCYAKILRKYEIWRTPVGQKIMSSWWETKEGYWLLVSTKDSRVLLPGWDINIYILAISLLLLFLLIYIESISLSVLNELCNHSPRRAYSKKENAHLYVRCQITFIILLSLSLLSLMYM